MRIKAIIMNLLKKTIRRIENRITNRHKLNLTKFDIVEVTYLDDALNSKEAITSNENDLIVSLTTYGKRIFDMFLVIESIAKQTVKPSKVILWLDENEFDSENIPLILKKQQVRGLEIKFCENIKSYKKLIPTILMHPNSQILTLDDDIIYPYDLIECMLKDSEKNPNCIIANLIHEITFKKGVLNKYKSWELISQTESASFLVFPVGAGGVLYPSNAFHSDVCNIKKFTSLAPHGDDIWFKAMSILNQVKSKRCSDSRIFKDRIVKIERSQDIGLFHYNLNGGRNDEQIKNVFENYRILELLLKINEH
jgi:hypothetical protein